MSDDASDQGRRNYSKQLAREYAEINTPLARAQRALDVWWEQRLLQRARARRSEIPERGDYSPVARFDRELDDAQQDADWRYTRGR
jgi:hypothetical protein